MALILDGKVTSQAVLAGVTENVNRLTGSGQPKLVAVLVGNNPASEVYVGRKVKMAAQVGIASETLRLPADIAQADLLAQLHTLNTDPTVHAILVQLPLPKHLDSQVILLAVDPKKDVDGFHPNNLGLLFMGAEPVALPCTPAGIIKLLDAYELPIKGKHAVVLGRSNIVGKPIALMLTHRHATVTLCHSHTRDLSSQLRQADIIIAAAGQPGLVTAQDVKPGVVIVDVGINRLPDGKLVGDVDFEAVQGVTIAITPVPGGVGPMTIAMLMFNTVRLYEASQGKPPAPWLFR